MAKKPNVIILLTDDMKLGPIFLEALRQTTSPKERFQEGNIVQ